MQQIQNLMKIILYIFAVGYIKVQSSVTVTVGTIHTKVTFIRIMRNLNSMRTRTVEIYSLTTKGY